MTDTESSQEYGSAAAESLSGGFDPLFIRESAALGQKYGCREDRSQQQHHRSSHDEARRKLYEVPVGFKYFVDGLLHGSLGFAGEESAGASFLRRDGMVWTTDKDGIIAALLAARSRPK